MDATRVPSTGWTALLRPEQADDKMTSCLRNYDGADNDGVSFGDRDQESQWRHSRHQRAADCNCSAQLQQTCDARTCDLFSVGLYDEVCGCLL